MKAFIGGQDEAIAQIATHFAAWEMDKSSDKHAPLVLAFTGPSGVGKSESAFRIGQALFNKANDPIDHNPQPVLVLRGEDYSEEAEIVVQHGVTEARKQLRNQIIDHLIVTGNEAMIIFDEVQKVVPGVLEVFLPALEQNGYFARVTHNKVTKEPTTKYFSTRHVVFIFISDIGESLLTKAILRYGGRHQIDGAYLRNEVKSLMDAQWARLQFGKTIRGVIPFFPLEPFHIWHILQKQIANLDLQGQQSKWLRLVVDDDVLDWLSTSELYKYEAVTAKFTVFNDSNSSSYISGEDTPATEISRTEVEAGESVEVTKYFAKWGARAGPLTDLRSLIWNMRLQGKFGKWRPGEIVHVGKLENVAMERRLCQPTLDGGASTTSSGQYQPPTIYLQWCSRKPYMLTSCHALDTTIGEGTCQNAQRFPSEKYRSETVVISSSMAENCELALCAHM